MWNNLVVEDLLGRRVGLTPKQVQGDACVIRGKVGCALRWPQVCSKSGQLLKFQGAGGEIVEDIRSTFKKRR